METSKTAIGILVAASLVAGASASYLLRDKAEVSQPPATVASLPVTQSAPAILETGIAEAAPSEPVQVAPRRTENTSSARPAATAVPATPPPASPARSSRASSRLPSPTPSPAASPEPEKPPTTRVVEIETEVVPDQPLPQAAAEPPASRAQFEEKDPPATFEEIVVSADSVIGLRVQTGVSSEDARLEDEVVAQVTRDVTVGDRVVIPAGSQAYGEVTLVERGGKMRERARLGVRFTSITLGDGTRIPIETETIMREGSSPSSESSKKIGVGAIGGAIIGGILGGARGAVLGGTAGAGAGTAVVMAGDRNAATLPAGAAATIRLLEPAMIVFER